MSYCLYGREVEVGDIDFEIGEGAYALNATFVDNGAELSDSDLEKLNEKYADELYESKFSDMCARAYDDYKAAR